MSDIKDRAVALLKQAVKDLEIVVDNYTDMAFNPEKGYCANNKCDNNCSFYIESLGGCQWKHLVEAEKLIEEYEQNKEHEDLSTIQKYAIGEGYLTNWYQTSVDIAESPVWTDEHLYELNEDFYLIPKRWFEGGVNNGTDRKKLKKL